MSVRKKFSLAVDGLGRGDHVVKIGQNEQKIQVRVIRFRIGSGETETLTTDIMDNEISMRTFKTMYFKQWRIETKYNEIKNKLEIENFSGRLVDNIQQDFYAKRNFIIIINRIAEGA